MRTTLTLTAAALLALGSHCSQLAAQQDATAAMFRGNPQLTGVYATKPALSLDAVKFSVTTGGMIRGAAALDNGTLYFGSGDGNLYAVDAQSGAERWRFKTGGPVTSSPAVANGTVFFASRDGKLYCVRARDGGLVWSHTFGKDLTTENYWDFYLSSPAIVGRALYVGSGDGHLYAFDIATGKTIWAFDAGSRVRSTPAVSDGLVVFGTKSGHIVAIAQKTGELRWKFATDGAARTFDFKHNDTTSVYMSPSIGGGAVLAGGRDGFIYCLDLATGKQRWKTTHDGGSWILSTAIDAGVAYIGSGSAYILQAADLATGRELWRFPTGGAVFGSPTIAGDVLYFSDFSGTLHALDKHKGTELWNFPMGHRSFSTPLVHDGLVYTSSDGGVLYALSGSTTKPSAPSTTRKLVYWQGIKDANSPGWFLNDVDTAILGFFKSSGYEQIDTKQLLAEIAGEQKDKGKSLIVFADNRFPDELAGDRTANAPIRRFLDAGGKIVFVGNNPFAYLTDGKTGAIVKADYNIPNAIFGASYPAPQFATGYYQSQPTSEGRALGLRDFYIANGGVTATPNITPLATDEFGLVTAWIKRYGGTAGGGLIQFELPRTELVDLAPYLAVIERGLQ